MLLSFLFFFLTSVIFKKLASHCCSLKKIIHFVGHICVIPDIHLICLGVYRSSLNLYPADSFSVLILSAEMVFLGLSQGGISLLHFMTYIKKTSTDSFCFTSPDLLKWIQMFHVMDRRREVWGAAVSRRGAARITLFEEVQSFPLHGLHL